MRPYLLALFVVCGLVSSTLGEDAVPILKSVIADYSANRDRLHTWQGSMTQRHVATGDPSNATAFREQDELEELFRNDTVLRHVTSEMEFALDFEAEALRISNQQVGSERWVGKSTGQEVEVVPRKLYNRDTILTQEHTLYVHPFMKTSAAHKDFSGTPAPPSGYLLVRREESDYDRVSQGGSYFDPRKMLLLFGTAIENNLDINLTGIQDDLFNIDVEQLKEGTVTLRWHPSDADHTVTIAAQNGRSLVVAAKVESPEGWSQAWQWDYQFHGDIFVPAHWQTTTIEPQEWGGRYHYTEILFEENRVNEPIDPAQFTKESLANNDGDRIIDSVAGENSVVWKGDKILPQTYTRLVEPLEPEASGSSVFYWLAIIGLTLIIAGAAKSWRSRKV